MDREFRQQRPYWAGVVLTQELVLSEEVAKNEKTSDKTEKMIEWFASDEELRLFLQAQNLFQKNRREICMGSHFLDASQLFTANSLQLRCVDASATKFEPLELVDADSTFSASACPAPAATPVPLATWLSALTDERARHVKQLDLESVPTLMMSCPRGTTKEKINSEPRLLSVYPVSNCDFTRNRAGPVSSTTALFLESSSVVSVEKCWQAIAEVLKCVPLKNLHTEAKPLNMGQKPTVMLHRMRVREAEERRDGSRAEVLSKFPIEGEWGERLEELFAGGEEE